MLAAEPDDSGTSKSERIREVHRQWQENLFARQAELEAGLMKPKKSPKKETHDPEWAKAKKVCRLNMDDIRKAKALGMSPKPPIPKPPIPKPSFKR